MIFLVMEGKTGDGSLSFHTASAPLLVGGAAFIGVTYVGTKIIDVASQYYYDGVGIE